jgi:hypothetical protein
MNGNVQMPSARGLLYEIRYEKTSSRDILKKPFGLSSIEELSDQLKD